MEINYQSILLNMLLHMAHLYPEIGNDFRQLALNILNDAIAELLERYIFSSNILVHK